MGKLLIAIVLACGCKGGDPAAPDASVGDDAGDGGVDAPPDAEPPGFFSVGGTARGMRAPVELTLRAGELTQKLLVTDDAPFKFGAKLFTGTTLTVDIESGSGCEFPAAGQQRTIADGNIEDLELSCRGVTELAELAFSTRVTLRPTFDREVTNYVAERFFLLQPGDLVSVTPTSSYAPAMTVNGVAVASAQASQLLDIDRAGPEATVQLSESTLSRPYVFDFVPAPLAEEAYVKPLVPNGNAELGTAIAIDGDTLAVGAPGAFGSAFTADAVFVFERTGTTWTEVLRIAPPAGMPEIRFGAAVALDGDTLAVGALENQLAPRGMVLIYRRTAGVWSATPEATLAASNAADDDRFGDAVALSGDTLVVGARGEDSNATGVGGNQGNNTVAESGAAYVFRRNGSGVWSQEAYLKASNTGANDQFGTAVGVSGDVIVVGAPNEDSSTTGVNPASNESAAEAGAAYVYRRSGTTWAFEAFVKASNTTAGDAFGLAVAVSNATLVVGAPFEDSAGPPGDNSALNAGAAYAYRFTSVWSFDAFIKASNVEAQDEFGKSVAADGAHIAVGANREASIATGIDGNPSDNTAPLAGAAYVFRRTAGGWQPAAAYIKASNSGRDDFFGSSISLDGSSLAVGARFERSAGAGVNNAMGADNSLAGAGAAYVFR